MKTLHFLLLAGFILTQIFTDAQEGKDLSITVDKKADEATFKCSNGKWEHKNGTAFDSDLKLYYSDGESGVYTCQNNENNEKKEKFIKILVKFRSCDNCIELDAWTLAAIAVGNILATVLVGVAVYSLSAQPKIRSFSGNKASDKVTLINNGDGDTYQHLSPNQTSAYSTIGGARRK